MEYTPRLSPRLALCASFVRQGARLADIGTDHGYLPIALLRAGKVSSAIASDVREGPLESARRNAARFGVAKEMRFVLADGLSGIGPEDADDVVLAGMGGELILRLIGEAPWLCAPEKRLILQPMTMAPVLRTGLAETGFAVLEERAVTEGEKVYTVFTAGYTGTPREITPLFAYMGRLSPDDPASGRYAQRVCRDLENRLRGLRLESQPTGALETLLREIRETYGLGSARSGPLE